MHATDAGREQQRRGDHEPAATVSPLATGKFYSD